MKDEKRPTWQELCAQAAVEQDPAKLLKLVTEINRIFTAADMRNQEAKDRDSMSAKSGNWPE